MFTFLFILTVLVFIGLVVVAGIRPMPHLVSQFELKRRSKANKEAQWQHRREVLLPDVYAALAAKTALLIVGFVALAIVTFGWGLGLVVGLIGVLLYPTIASWNFASQQSQKLYDKYEPGYLDIIVKLQPVFKVLRSVAVPRVEPYHRFDSREELQDMIDRSNVLSDDERKLIVHSLGFKHEIVESIMTPKSLIKTVKKTEFLGPLVLSEIHELGHSRLPVIGADLDHVVGTLHIRDLLSLDVKQSVTAEKAMEAKVFYIRHDQTLEHALAAFIETRHHLFIVINEARETVGLLTLEDVMEALLGRTIMDEDDNHEDVHSVAAHRAVHNNVPEHRVDV